MAALIALISPLPYSADFRPYFTIHDPDFRAMTTPDPAPTYTNLPRLLGVTNRYFLKVGTRPQHVPDHNLGLAFTSACPSMALAGPECSPSSGPVCSSARECFASKAALLLHSSNQCALKCVYEELWILILPSCQPADEESFNCSLNRQPP